jgi:UPF0716 protein FxsA
MLGGALLLAPGFITDVVGFALLIPPTRAVFRSVVARLAKRRIAFGWAIPSSPGGPGSGPRPGPRPTGFGTRSRPDYDYEGTAREVDAPELDPGKPGEPRE